MFFLNRILIKRQFSFPYYWDSYLANVNRGEMRN